VITRAKKLGFNARGLKDRKKVCELDFRCKLEWEFDF